jgi:hypothetical protein
LYHPILARGGVRIGNGSAQLDNLSSQIPWCLIELSFKGTNEQEFSLLSGRNPEQYQYQLEAYKKLSALVKNNPKIQVVAVLGVYHSAVNATAKYAFVNPIDGKILFDDIKNWNPEFRSIWQSAKFKWVEPLRMSPKGVWDNLWNRCGPNGSGILRYYAAGTPINPNHIFPAKPKSYDYAQKIIKRDFWST